MTLDALLDSNVVIAMLVEAHQHHRPSIALVDLARSSRLAVAAHSYAECFSTLTRRGGGSPIRFTPEEAVAALESVRRVTTLVGLTPGQTFDAIKGYARRGGVGPRLYDALIGETAVVHGLPRILTWNLGHMRELFPNLEIRTPAEP